MHNGDGNQNEIQRAFSSYVKSCLRHASRDYFQKTLRHTSYTIAFDEKIIQNFDLSIHFCLSASSQIDNQTTLLQIIKELNLSHVEKRVLFLKYCRDLTDKEIANNLGISRQAISKTKSRVLLKIKNSLTLYS